ncbi:uncharacterized protein TNCT_577081 [Trichonephila clavata]|uniref:Uncharacterized protein n=1 Tax=Trichonephila clavata TaxID=2740835 RepID=A0A8X6GGM0_TRICU|nr:uncharacterized protein TNCT_577081 [Trichonephila clavata]
MNIYDLTSEEFVHEDTEHSQSSTKIEELRKESQASHINRIRFAFEKQKVREFERNTYGLPKETKKASSSFKIKSKSFQNRINPFDGTKSNLNVNDGSEIHRFLNLRVNKRPIQRNTESSGDTEIFDNGQGGVHIISSNNSFLNTNGKNNFSRRRRKQWSIAPKSPTTLNATFRKNYMTERDEDENFSQSYFSSSGTEKSNLIEGRLQPSESIEQNMIARRPATEKDAAIIQWLRDMARLQPEGVTDDENYNISDEENEESFEKESAPFSVSEEGLFTKPEETKDANKNVSKNSKNSGTKKLKRCSKTVRKTQLPSTKMTSQNCEKLDKNKNAKKMKVTPQNESKAKSPFKISRTRNEHLNITVDLKNLKRKDRALLVWFDDLINPGSKRNTGMENDRRKARSLIKFRKEFIDLEREKMAVFKSLFKDKNTNHSEEGSSE